MKSKIAEDVSRERDRSTQELPVSDRIALALRLGSEAVRTFASTNNVSEEEARRILRRNNQIGRRPSKVMSED